MIGKASDGGLCVVCQQPPGAGPAYRDSVPASTCKACYEKWQDYVSEGQGLARAQGGNSLDWNAWQGWEDFLVAERRPLEPEPPQSQPAIWDSTAAYGD